MSDNFSIISRVQSLWLLLLYSAVINILFWMSQAAESSRMQLYVLGLFLPLIVCRRWFQVVKGKLFLFALGGWFTGVRLFFADHYVPFALNGGETEPLSTMFYLLSTISLMFVICFFVGKKVEPAGDSCDLFMEDDQS